jgi:hypothetical protein
VRSGLVGCGFVGSLFLEEALKLSFAGDLPMQWRCLDSDTWERRNAANQNVTLADAYNGLPKAETMVRLCSSYERVADAGHDRYQVRITDDNVDDMLYDCDLVIDAVDNLATRQLLWRYCLGRNIPCLHLGITEDGTGQVQWSHPRHDTFALAPYRLGNRVIVDPPSGVKPPCELARMRSVGWLTSYAAAVAWAIYWGVDPNEWLPTNTAKGTLTNWATTGVSLIPCKETWVNLEALCTA